MAQTIHCQNHHLGLVKLRYCCVTRGDSHLKKKKKKVPILSVESNSKTVDYAFNFAAGEETEGTRREKTLEGKLLYTMDF